MHCRSVLAFPLAAFTSTVEAQRTPIDSVRLTDTTVIHVVISIGGGAMTIPGIAFRDNLFMLLPQLYLTWPGWRR